MLAPRFRVRKKRLFDETEDPIYEDDSARTRGLGLSISRLHSSCDALAAFAFGAIPQEAANLNDHEDSRRYNHRSNESRYHRHVLICADSRRALAMVRRVKRGGFALAAILAASSMVLSGASSSIARAGFAGVATACGAVCSLALSAAAVVFEGHFFSNFERHSALE